MPASLAPRAGVPRQRSRPNAKGGKKFYVSQDLDSSGFTELADFFREEISIQGTYHIRLAGERGTENGLIRAISDEVGGDWQGID
jgi:hypothetical protein